MKRTAKVARIAKIFRVVKIYKLFMKPETTRAVGELIDEALSYWCHESLLHNMFCLLRLMGAMLKFVLVIFIESHIATCVLLSVADGAPLSWAYAVSETADLTPWMRY